MKGLKVGDRVRVFTWDPEDETVPLVFKAIVSKHYDTGMIAVTPVDCEAEALKYPDWIVHPKQCRKLVKKERRMIELLVCARGRPHGFGVMGCTCALTPEQVTFVEVRKKK